MENLKTQTVKHTYYVTLICSNVPTTEDTYIIDAESLPAALREAANRCIDSAESGTYDVSVRCPKTDKEIYANTLVAPDAYSFLRKCAVDAAMIACKVYEGGHDK